MEELYKRLILSWREAFEGLTAEEKAIISNLDDFRAPCQIEVIVLGNPQLGITNQIWLFSHFKDEPDLNIIIDGPINSVDARSKLPEISKSNRFERLLPEKTRFLGAKTYRDLIESHLLSLVESVRNLAVRKLWSEELPREGVSVKRMLSEEAFIWEFQGVLDSKAIDGIVTQIMKAAKDKTRQKEQAQAPTGPPKRNEIKAKGTLIYPHVWIGSRPLHSFEDDVNDRMYAQQRRRIGPDETIVFDKVGKLFGLTTREGLVAITLEDNALALRILNSFMSLMTLRGTPALAIRENELVELTLDPNTGKVLGSHASIVLPRMLPYDLSFVRPRWEEERMPVLEVNFVKQVWKDLARVLEDDFTLNLLQIFGEVYTHFQRTEYPQTILLAWTMVEKWYASIQDRVAKAEKLTKTRRYNRVQDIIQLLETEALIDRDVASQMYQLRLLRNEVVHTLKYVTKEEAQFALSTVVSILQGKKS